MVGSTAVTGLRLGQAALRSRLDFQEVHQPSSRASHRPRFDAILADCTKLIEGDIVWQEDEDHLPSLEFKKEIFTAGGWPLFTHKHCWSEEFKDKQAYEPEDITAAPDNPIQAWQQFCQEATIQHKGRMHPPPPLQGDLFL